ncbi:mitochondrial amidoxime-reducing component 1-like [Scaptodrosophila lebanonensis]|uniref:Mitochondrial amidoxime-reducing component 1-like n=1 Tax=Drosophila lebanonensis TaxID=7225 RepID=A0A6J2TA33_DROLE|nr:mitochondrial amidoxime-reducing component 1-like [Scaptodrosophila lebanonensis]
MITTYAPDSGSGWFSGKVLLGVGVGLVVAGGASYLIYHRLKRDVVPEKWRRVGILEEINLFPVKSCAPLKLKDGDVLSCDLLGLTLQGIRDRALMLVNDNNEMITARGYPKMLLIQPQVLSSTGLVFKAPGTPDLELNFETLASESPGQDVHTAVWGVKLDAMLCGARFDKWFSQFILGQDTGLKLVYYPYPSPVRATNPRLKDQPYIKQEDSGTFGDATSYMIMNLSSIADLNKRLKRPVSPLQFRGNFELKMDNDEPYAEDNWQWVRIGDVVFRVVAPCTRCILPNINVHTAERDVDGEPLKTLRSYRLFNYASPALGSHLGLRVPGNIKVNDIIYVESK